MKTSMTAMGITLAAATLAATSPATAQNTSRVAQPSDAQQDTEGPQVTPSKGALKAIVELKTAVDANDVANIPARLAAAQAVAATPQDRFVIAQLQLQAAGAAKDMISMAAAMESILASGLATPAMLVPLNDNLGKIYYNAKQYDRAAAAFERVLQLQPADAQTTKLLADVRAKQGRTDEALGLLTRSIATQAGKPSEDLYEQAISIAYQAKSPAAIELSRDWVGHYPTSGNWRDALLILRNLNQFDDAAMLDVLRLGRATGGQASAADYERHAFLALSKGYPAEAKAVLEEGIAAQKIDRGSPNVADLLSAATTKSAADEGELEATVTAAQAGSAARPALTTGDWLYGLGDYRRAAELYRSALGKSGADADLINLHLGMTLAQSGDSAGARAALSAVGGSQARIAGYWLAHLSGGS